jgi:hypothetical protein
MSVSTPTPSPLSRTGGRLLLAGLLVVIAALAVVVGVLAAGSGSAAAPASTPTVHSTHASTTNPCELPRMGRPLPC